MLGGLPIAYFPYANLRLGHLTLAMATTAGAGSLIIGVLLVVLGVSLWFQKHVRFFAGVAAILLALVSIPVSNLGGFLIGFLFALTGGAMAVSWAEDAPPAQEPVDARGSGHRPHGHGHAGAGHRTRARIRARWVQPTICQERAPVSTGYAPTLDSAESMTASAPSRIALATSEASARVGRELVIIDSIIWVATITGLALRRHSSMSRFCTMGTFSRGYSTARSPRATITPSNAMTTSSMLSTACGFSTLAMTGRGGPPRP
ncbi:hypothetical protein SGLAM104S_02160 [Streptomyces glaucescens]